MWLRLDFGTKIPDQRFFRMIALQNRLSRYYPVSDEVWSQVQGIPKSARIAQPGDDIIREGDIADRIFIIRYGWAIRHKMLEDGRRQIVNFMMPGDVFDLQALSNLQSDHSVSAVTETEYVTIEQDVFLKTIVSNPQTAFAFWWSAVQEEAILREQTLRLGRMNAKERIGHLLLELRLRMNTALGRHHDALPLPLTRTDIADALGLTSVHVSRTMSQMRRCDLIREDRNSVIIVDQERLMALCHFDDAYLHLSGPPRKMPAFSMASTRR